MKVVLSHYYPYSGTELTGRALGEYFFPILKFQAQGCVNYPPEQSLTQTDYWNEILR